MPWVLLVLATAAFVVAFKATSMVLLVLCLLLALGLSLAGVMSLLARRVGSRSRDESMMIDPQELRRLREQAQARRTASAARQPPDGPPA